MIHLEKSITYLQTQDYSACERHKTSSKTTKLHQKSRTHRVDLDRLHDRINFDRMIEIKYVNTTQQLADILTKGSFTRKKAGRS